eukprot:TRINITY_DN13956_c0_g2_i3.p1 TRINITY_DN13956_c0_g2~~TRINITY_DN13956_c0_g2_i3.p1  ORF type:complete len:857 (+),score=288.61 TRINITY_DN13956_c0_g2_i3:93-2573(+)
MSGERTRRRGRGHRGGQRNRAARRRQRAGSHQDVSDEDESGEWGGRTFDSPADSRGARSTDSPGGWTPGHSSQERRARPPGERPGAGKVRMVLGSEPGSEEEEERRGGRSPPEHRVQRRLFAEGRRRRHDDGDADRPRSAGDESWHSWGNVSPPPSRPAHVWAPALDVPEPPPDDGEAGSSAELSSPTAEAVLAALYETMAGRPEPPSPRSEGSHSPCGSFVLRNILSSAALGQVEGDEADGRMSIEAEVFPPRHMVRSLVAHAAELGAVGGGWGPLSTMLPPASWDSDLCRLALLMALAVGSPELAQRVFDSTAFAGLHRVKARPAPDDPSLPLVFGFITVRLAEEFGIPKWCWDGGAARAAESKCSFVGLAAACISSAFDALEPLEALRRRQQVFQIIISAPNASAAAADVAAVETALSRTQALLSTNSTRRCMEWWAPRLVAVDAESTFQPRASARDKERATGAAKTDPEELESLYAWSPDGHEFYSASFRSRMRTLLLSVRRRGLLRSGRKGGPLLALLSFVQWATPLKRTVRDAYPTQRTVVDSVSDGSIVSLDASDPVMALFSTTSGVPPHAGMKLQATRPDGAGACGLVTGCRYCGPKGDAVLHWRPSGAVSSEPLVSSADTAARSLTAMPSQLHHQPPPAGGLWVCGTCRVFPRQGQTCSSCGENHVRSLCVERRRRWQGQQQQVQRTVVICPAPAREWWRGKDQRQQWQDQRQQWQQPQQPRHQWQWMAAGRSGGPFVSKLNMSARPPQSELFDAGDRVCHQFGVQAGEQICVRGRRGSIAGLGLDDALYWAPAECAEAEVERLAVTRAGLLAALGR